MTFPHYDSYEYGLNLKKARTNFVLSKLSVCLYRGITGKHDNFVNITIVGTASILHYENLRKYKIMLFLIVRGRSR